MIDDLITKDTLEPYRMFTSRAEFRLMLRFSNTFYRLKEFSEKNKLLTKKDEKNLKNITLYKTLVEKSLCKSIGVKTLKNKEKIKQKTPARNILKRPSVSIFDLIKKPKQRTQKIPTWLEEEIMYDVESDVKYEGYIKRHLKEIKQIEKNNNLEIPKKLVFSNVPGLSNEAVEKLAIIKPENLGQASRVSGIRPSDISVLNIYLNSKVSRET